MVDLRTTKFPMEMATNAMAKAGSQDSGANVVNSTISGLEKGISLIDSIDKYREKKKQAKTIADAIIKVRESKDFQTYNKETNNLAEVDLQSDPKEALSHFTEWKKAKEKAKTDSQKESKRVHYGTIVNHREKLQQDLQEAQSNLDKLKVNIYHNKEDEFNEALVTDPTAKMALINLNKAQKAMSMFAPTYKQALEGLTNGEVETKQAIKDTLGLGL